ncbi:MAG: hypothetical protein Q4F05_11755 [bacterium]|nr:hypothetical protein [bacterium]
MAKCVAISAIPIDAQCLKDARNGDSKRHITTPLPKRSSQFFFLFSGIMYSNAVIKQV